MIMFGIYISLIFTPYIANEWADILVEPQMD